MRHLMYTKQLMLDDEFLDEIQYVKENGIGWIEGFPCVADWYVPYEISHKIFIHGYDDFGVGLMRGSKLGVHLMAIANGDTSKYAGDYYFANKLANKFASAIKNKKQMTLSFNVNKKHPFFTCQRKSEPHGKCWDRELESTVIRALTSEFSPEKRNKFLDECRIKQTPIYYVKKGKFALFYEDDLDDEEMSYEFSIVPRRFSHMSPIEFFET